MGLTRRLGMGWLSVRGYVAIVMLVAVAATVALAAFAGVETHHRLVAALAFAVAFVVIQLLPIPVPRGSQTETVRIEEALVVPMVLVLPPIVSVLTIGAGVLTGLLISRASLRKIIFNVAQMMAATAACAAVVYAAVGILPQPTAVAMSSAVAGLVAMFVVNQLFMAGIMNRAGAVPVRTAVLDGLALKAALWVANAAIGLLLVLPVFGAPLLTLVALVPLAFLHMAFRASAEHARDVQRLGELNAAAGGMAGEVQPDPIARQLAMCAREVVGAYCAEVTLFSIGYSFTICREGDGLRTSEHEIGNQQHQLDSSRGHVSFVVPMIASTGPIGELRVWHDQADSTDGSVFSRHDHTLLEMLARQASTSLDNAALWARSGSQRRTIEQVFKHSSEGMLVLGAGGRVRGWNPAMKRISGFLERDVVDSPISLLSPELGCIAEADGAGVVNAVISTADGSRRQVRASYAPIELEADSKCSPEWVVVIRDMTSEREVERLQNDFVATVSHELRTPLTAIKGFVETMRRDDVDLDDGQVRMFLDIMGEQADRLEHLINDLLDISTIESGRTLNVDLAPMDVVAAVRNAACVFEAAKPGAQLQLNLPRLPVIVMADHNRLAQVLTNLMDNAYKHAGADAGGPIELAVNWVGDNAEVIVRDHGPGISSSDLQHIFDRFFVAADSVTRQGGGAGLGLYICRRLLDAMHGGLEAHSTSGEGSSFVVRIPTLANQSAVGRNELPSSPYRGRRDDSRDDDIETSVSA